MASYRYQATSHTHRWEVATLDSRYERCGVCRAIRRRCQHDWAPRYPGYYQCRKCRKLRTATRLEREETRR